MRRITEPVNGNVIEKLLWSKINLALKESPGNFVTAKQIVGITTDNFVCTREIVQKYLSDFFCSNQETNTFLQAKLIEFKTKQEWVVMRPNEPENPIGQNNPDQDDQVVKRRKTNTSWEDQGVSTEQLFDELGYLQLVENLIYRGWQVPDRTGTGTRFLPGCTVKYDVSGFQLPLVTTRKILWKNIVAELLFFLRGETNTKVLEEQGVRIWKENTSRSFLDGRGLGPNKKAGDPSLILEEGDMGPAYGFQWRHFGAGSSHYTGCKGKSYQGLGFDQIAAVMDGLKRDPYGRRHLVTAFCPSDTHLMALPPCHFAFQFVVQPPNEPEARMRLHIIVSQRSADIILGVPTNVASYALLLFIFCHYVDMEPGTLTHNMGHAHIYNSHIEPARLQLSRTPSVQRPRLSMINMPNEMSSLSPANFIVQDYSPAPFIKFPFAV